MKDKLNILIANDDGIDSPGIVRLAEAAAKAVKEAMSGSPRRRASAAACPRSSPFSASSS